MSETAEGDVVGDAVGGLIDVGLGVDVYLLVDVSASISEDSFMNTKTFLQALISNVSMFKHKFHVCHVIFYMLCMIAVHLLHFIC